MKEFIRQEFLDGSSFKLSKFARKSYLEKHYPKVVKVVLENTKHIEWTDKFSELVYCYLNDIVEKPACKECGGDLNFKQFSNGYPAYCKDHSRTFKKGKKWEDFGKTPEETKKRMQLANGKRTGKTWEEIFGKEKTQEMKESMSEKLSDREITEEWKEKISKSNKGRLKGNKNPMRNPKVVETLKETFVERGLKIPDDQLTDFKLYKRKVRELTESEFRKNYYELENSEKRGNGFDLDHKFSIFEGFKQNLPIYLIGSIHNLEMICSKENKSKHVKCSTTVNKILKGIRDESKR